VDASGESVSAQVDVVLDATSLYGSSTGVLFTPQAFTLHFIASLPPLGVTTYFVQVCWSRTESMHRVDRVELIRTTCGYHSTYHATRMQVAVSATSPEHVSCTSPAVRSELECYTSAAWSRQSSSAGGMETVLKSLWLILICMGAPRGFVLYELPTRLGSLNLIHACACSIARSGKYHDNSDHAGAICASIWSRNQRTCWRHLAAE